MAVVEVAAPLPCRSLPDADWADSFEVTLPEPYPNARSAAEAIVSAFPGWVRPLFVLRTILVAPFGLKGAGDAGKGGDNVGIFPVVSATQDRMVAGFDDRHLDFRILVDIAPQGRWQVVRLTTVIRRHNLLGRGYLALILPFHRAIIRTALARLSSVKA